MVAAVSDQFNHLVERVIVIDCRYPYEFEGGHIKVRVDSDIRHHVLQVTSCNLMNELFVFCRLREL